MTLRRRHQRVALKLCLKSAHKRLNDAMQAMDYEAALACQIQIHDLERELGQRSGAAVPSKLPSNDNFMRLR
jgi:protein-arginine kinase activator protein McsA